MGNAVFAFQCATCEETHVGMPTFAAAAPLSYVALPATERDTRCELDTDHCVIDRATFFVRACIEIPVWGYDEPFVWGVWVSLSRPSYDAWRRVFASAQRRHVGPFFAWLDARLRPYPDTANLKTRLHLRDNGVRPFVELEPTDHPLAVEQRNGISVSRVAEIYSIMMHDPAPRAPPAG